MTTPDEITDDGLDLLRRTVREPVEHVESFPAPSDVTVVRFTTDEVTSVCPVTGQPDFVEKPTLRRSNAHDSVAAEVKATREAVGMFESAIYARYEVTGPGAAAWLDRLLAAKLPKVGRVRLAPMLNPSGNLMGDLTVSRLAEDRFWLIGSYLWS